MRAWCHLLTSMLAIGIASCLIADQVFEVERESLFLKNICQLTNPSMGFSKAGEAYFSPDGSTIIFQAVPHGEDQYQIYTLDLKEGVARMVSTGKGACTCAFFHPDGKKIIFASSHSAPEDEAAGESPGYKRDGGHYSWQFTPYMNIYEANPDGSGLTPLTTGPAYSAECAYSPSGDQIVFASNRSGSMNLYVMRSDGSEVAAVTATEVGYNGGPFFSPDGCRIIFRADYEKPHYLQVYLIDKEGGNLCQLTDNGAVNWAPFWHPDGAVIAFTTSLHGHAHYEIYLMDVATKASYRLTHHPGFDGLPSFNRSGDKLLWTSKRSEDGSCQIFIADFAMPSFFN